MLALFSANVSLHKSCISATYLSKLRVSENTLFTKIVAVHII